MARIIINADDFGFSEETVRATIECFEAGGLTSATIMPNMPGTEAAIRYAREHPEFSYGAHLTFTSDGGEYPLLDQSRIPDLVDERGQFLPPLQMRAKAMRGRLPVDQLEAEMRAQLSRLLDAGVPLSHVDSHGHVHKFKALRCALQRVLPCYGIRRVRTVQDVYLTVPYRSPTYWLGKFWHRAIEKHFVTTDHFFMPTTAGDADWIEPLMSRVNDGTIEIGVHPGYEEPWRDAERTACLLFTRAARERGHEIVPWSAI